MLLGSFALYHKTIKKALEIYKCTDTISEEDAQEFLQ